MQDKGSQSKDSGRAGHASAQPWWGFPPLLSFLQDTGPRCSHRCMSATGKCLGAWYPIISLYQTVISYTSICYVQVHKPFPANIAYPMVSVFSSRSALTILQWKGEWLCGKMKPERPLKCLQLLTLYIFSPLLSWSYGSQTLLRSAIKLVFKSA